MADANDDLRTRLGAWLDVVKGLLTVVAGGAVLLLFLADFGALRDATQSFLRRIASSASDIKIMGVFDLTLDEQAVSSALAPFEDAAQSAPDVKEKIRALEPDEFARLMDVGLLQNTCEFERPTAEMRGFVALDYTLAEKGLTKIADNPKTKADVAAYLQQHPPQERSVAIGLPLSCYDLSLSDLGFRVKTALLQNIKYAFDPRSRSRKPTP